MASAALRWSESARIVYQQAARILGWDVADLCLHGPATQLDSPRHAPVVVHVTNLAVAASLSEKGLSPVAVAGHSVGEISALVFCGAIDPDDGVRLVDERSRLMASVGADGGMAAVVGLPPPVVARLCDQLRSPDGLLRMAADNGPRHVTVAGTRTELGQVAEQLAGRRGVRTLPLRAAGPFHTAAYASVTPAWASVVASVAISAPEMAFASSVTGGPLYEAGSIRQALIAQLTAPVRWREASLAIPAFGARCLIEAGEAAGVARLARLTLGRTVSTCDGVTGPAQESAVPPVSASTSSAKTIGG